MAGDFVVPVSFDLGPLVGQANILDMALNVVLAYPPTDRSLKSWPEEEEHLLANKEFALMCLTTDEFDQIGLPYKYKDLFGGLNIQGDAGTALMRFSAEKTMIVTFIFYDKLFFNDRGQEYPDSFTRLLVALGHEIYGNVISYLRMNEEQLAKPSAGLLNPVRIGLEITAFQAGIDLIDRVLGQQDDAKKLPLKTQMDLRVARQRETKTLDQMIQTGRQRFGSAKGFWDL